MVLAGMQFETRAHARQSIEALGYRPRKFVEAGQLFDSKRFNLGGLANCTRGRLMDCPSKRLAQGDDWRDVTGRATGPNRQAEIDVAAGKCRELASPFLPLLSC